MYTHTHTFTHRQNCLVVMLRYLNELSFYYLAAESAELAQVHVCGVGMATEWGIEMH